MAEGTIEYIYAADGRKLQTIQTWYPVNSTQPVSNQTAGRQKPQTAQILTKTYCSNIIYTSTPLSFGEGLGVRYLTENGYIEDGMYYFFVKDYLGNNRLVLDEDAVIVQQNNYYPFGMNQIYSAEQQDEIPYKFSGKELESGGGLHWYDFSARFYDAARGSFGQIDPLAEKYYEWSPYLYCGANPVNRTDPTGMYWVYYITYIPKEGGEFVEAEHYEWVDDDYTPETPLAEGQRFVGENPEDAMNEIEKNNGSSSSKSTSTTSTASTVLGAVGTTMQQSTSSVSISSSSASIPPQIYPNGLWNGSIMFGETTLKVASVGKLLGNIGIGLGMYSLYTDYKQWKNGNMSNFRLGYHTATFGVSLFGMAGVLGSTIMYGAETITDKIVVPAHKSFWQFGESLKNPSTWGQMYGY